MLMNDLPSKKQLRNKRTAVLAAAAIVCLGLLIVNATDGSAASPATVTAPVTVGGINYEMSCTVVG